MSQRTTVSNSLKQLELHKQNAMTDIDSLGLAFSVQPGINMQTRESTKFPLAPLPPPKEKEDVKHPLSVFVIVTFCG